MMEIELKLACYPDAIDIFEEKILPELAQQNVKVRRSKTTLYNEYFDTEDEFFSKRKMGLRLRCNDSDNLKQFEQTIKTRGKVVGGLHQRPEYNVALSNNKIDLALFDADIWADDIDVTSLNQKITSLFSTHFKRITFKLSSDNSEIEVVFDVGEVKRQNESTPICEIELELVKGDTIALFDTANYIVKHIPCRLSNQTKASRGYQLLHGSQLQTVLLPKFLALDINDSTEKAFCQTLEVGLVHWQHHQQAYAQTSRLKTLTQIRESLELLLQGVSLYLPILQCKELLELHKDLLALNQTWSWQKQLLSIHHLRRKNGPFSRRIPKNQNLMNYLVGRREGLLNAHKPEQINHSSLSSKVQLSISRLLIEKPWRRQNEGADLPVKKHANGWLSQTWQTMQQTLPSQAKMDDKQYLAMEVLLKQSLTNGFLLADLFADSRGDFRAPWLDLASGIEELNALAILQSSFNDLKVEDPKEFAQWIDDKKQSVIKVMEQTRQVAMNAETYW